MPKNDKDNYFLFVMIIMLLGLYISLFTKSCVLQNPHPVYDSIYYY